MIGELSRPDMEQVLRDEILGRIGCHARGDTYVVPITYVFDGASIIGHTGNGLKVRMMRENPSVCFEVEQLQGTSNWRTVIAFGRFEELAGDTADTALDQLRRRVRDFAQKQGSAPAEGLGLWVPGTDATRARESIVFAIRVEKLTGRYQFLEGPR